MKNKPKIGIFSLTSCEGCQFTILDLGEKFFDFLKKVELIDFPLIEEMPFPKEIKIDVSFVEGNPITKEDLSLLKKIRKESKILVALGNCAALGGIPELKNYQSKEKTIRYIYKKLNNIANPEIKEIDNFVKVDFTIPGCPISGEEFLKMANSLIKGKIPEICQSPVCLECPFRGKEDCFLRKKEPCFGPMILAGCQAVCPKNQLPCYGCRGLLKNINYQNFIKILERMKSQEKIDDILEIFGIKDNILEQKTK